MTGWDPSFQESLRKLGKNVIGVPKCVQDGQKKLSKEEVLGSICGLKNE